jgi:FkbM family methyltransferase
MRAEGDMHEPGHWRVQAYEALLRVRPAQVGALLKRCLCIRRRYVPTATGHRFWADPVSVFGLHLLRQHIYEPRMTKLLSVVLRPADTFLDVGGNEGYFSVIASSLMSDGAVHCIEPQSRLQPILRENIRANHARVMVHHLAFSDQESEVALFLRPSTNTGASSLFPHWKLGRAKEMIQAVTLAQFFRAQALTHIRLLKVDCEGAEALVIHGGQEVFMRQAVDFIALEYHPTICGSDQCRATHARLLAAGYVLTKLHEQYIYHLPGLDEVLKPCGEIRVGCGWDA